MLMLFFKATSIFWQNSMQDIVQQFCDLLLIKIIFAPLYPTQALDKSMNSQLSSEILELFLQPQLFLHYNINRHTHTQS